MKEASYIVTLCVLAVLCFQISQMPHTTLRYALYGYLVCQTILVALAFFAGPETSEFYAKTFYGWMAVDGLAMLVLCALFAGWLPSLAHFIFSVLAACGLCAWIAYSFLDELKRAGMLTVWERMNVAMGSLFLLCGLFSLLTLIHRADTVNDVIRAAMTLLWLIVGVYCLWFQEGMILREKAFLVVKFSWMPTIAALVILSGLSLFLHSQQELSRQPAPEHVAAMEAE